MLYCLNCRKFINKKHNHKTILVHKELMVVVKMLIERGFKVTSTSCETNHMFLGHPYIEKVTHIQIEFGALYPKALLSGLPPDWVLYEYHTVDDDKCISDYTYSAISCSERHPITESGKADIRYAKRLNISNLECYLSDIDPASFWSVLKLGGIEPY
ncbi:hypothetical protein [Clostridium sp. DJ247]|uniref:hypothetical protein n=1 Tax=Clostridium sp. DJ247 TaxID=2726188 RepID=UPI00162AA64A|nr:hypothetical protein [Clostridium sp. DJ247]MBC2581774.1 hypothetical protein [Clostridium sp. DJ247]